MFGFSPLSSTPISAVPAVGRYWVGGSGTWDASTTTNWAYITGGVAGATAPTASDDVIFDSNSNSGTSAFTVTVSTGSLCKNFSTGGYGGDLDGAMSLALSGTTVAIYGSLLFPATNLSLSITTSGQFNFSSTATGNIISFNGVTSATATTLLFNGIGGGWTLGSAVSFSSASSLMNFQDGSFSTAGFAITTGLITITTGSGSTRSVSLGASTISLSGLTTFADTTTSGTTFNAGTSAITCSSVGAVTFNSGGLGNTFYDVSFTGVTGSLVIGGTNTFHNFTTSTPTNVKTLQFQADQTISGTMTIGTSASAIQRTTVNSNGYLTPRTLTVATMASLSNVDFQSIVAAGASSPWSGTNIGNLGNTTNITFTAAKTVYWSLAAGGNWSAVAWATTSGGTPATANFPLAQDTAIITDTGLNSGATITQQVAWSLPEINFTGRTLPVTWAGAGQAATYGSLTLTSAVTITGTGLQNIYPDTRGTLNLTSAGVSTTRQVQIVGTVGTGTVKLLDDFNTTSTSNFVFNSGTLDLNGKTLTCIAFQHSSSTRAIAFGTGNITVTATNATVWSNANALSFSLTGTPTVNLTGAGIGGQTRTISNGSTLGGTEANSVSFNVTTGADAIAFSGSTTEALRNVNFTGFTGTLNATTVNIYGDLTLVSGMTIASGTQVITFGATSGTQLITTAGQTIDRPIQIGDISAGGTVKFQDNFTMASTRSIAHQYGTLDANNKNVSIGLYSSNVTNTRALLMGSGTWTLTGTGTVWNLATSTGMTLTPSTSTIVFNGSGIGTFNGGSLTYNDLVQGSLNALTINSSNTFNTISNTVQPTTVTFTAGTTNTFTSFNLTGTSGNLVTINSSSAGTRANISKASGTVNAFYLYIQDSNATGGATWTASLANGNVNGGNNSGWIINAVYNDSITEVSTLIDIPSVLAIFNSAIVENSGLADTSSVQIAYGVSRTENSGLADNIAVQFASNVGITEAFISTDLSTTQITFNCFAVENMVILDQLEGLGWFLVDDSQTVTWNSLDNTQSITWTNVGDDQTPNWVVINNMQ